MMKNILEFVHHTVTNKSLGINQARRSRYSTMNEEFWLCMSKRKMNVNLRFVKEIDSIINNSSALRD